VQRMEKAVSRLDRRWLARGWTATAALVLTAGSGGCSSESSGDSRGPTEGTRAPYVLVHGAFNGAWVWADVAAALEAKGIEVTVVELPAHGEDQTPVAEATLEAYVSTVDAAVEAAGDRVVLVGHSMAGMVITAVAEQMSDRIDKLVYLAAYVPKDGEKMGDLAAMDADSHIGPVLVIDGAAGTASLPKSALEDIFCADCSAAALARLESHYRDEPLGAFGTPVHSTAASWGSVAKYYVHTEQDHAVSPGLQQKMTAGVTFAKKVSLPTSHSPHLSQPDLLVETLLGF